MGARLVELDEIVLSVIGGVVVAAGLCWVAVVVGLRLSRRAAARRGGGRGGFFHS